MAEQHKPPPAVAKRRRAVPQSKGKHWKDTEEKNLLDIVSEVLPRGAQEWEQVEDKFNIILFILLSL
jgi:hypothetical protein